MTGDRIRILVVDDEETVRDLLQRSLEEVGYDVVAAANGEEALFEMSQREVEVVLLDVKMPGMSGIEVLGKLTTDWPDICVIMATAVADVQTSVETMKLGAYDYITKPFNLDDLVLKVQKAIEKRNLQLRNKRLLLELQQSIKEQSERMNLQFNELVNSLAREHKLLHELAAGQPGSAKALLSKLPPELQEPMSSFEDFRNALLKILRGGR